MTAYNAAGQAVSRATHPRWLMLPTAPSARYVMAGYGAIANAGRNTFPLHPINNVDVQLKKRFNITERMAIDFGAEFYNIFNHPQWTGGSVNDVGLFGFTDSRLFLTAGPVDVRRHQPVPEQQLTDNSGFRALYVLTGNAEPPSRARDSQEGSLRAPLLCLCARCSDRRQRFGSPFLTSATPFGRVRLAQSGQLLLADENPLFERSQSRIWDQIPLLS